MNELEVAKAISLNKLPSPQIIGNAVLFALRITGTGAAFREKWNEYVFRDPAKYLTDDAIQLCNGAPVIFNHPDGDILTNDNFQDHIIGTIIYSYVNNNEVWGIARIYDTDAALSMIDDNLSTSPTFILAKENQKRIAIDNMTVLVEGNPLILDHVAICNEGVWNKGDDLNNGILINNEDLKMDDENTPDLEAKADAEIPAPAPAAEAPAVATDADGVSVSKADIDRLFALIDKQQQLTEQLTEQQLHELDELRASLGSTQESVAAKAEADEQDKAGLTSRLGAIEDKMKEPQELTDDEKAKVADSENEADKVAQAFGDSVKHAMRGEKADSFQRRVAKAYQSHSAMYKGVNLDAINDNTALDIAFKQICADSVVAASRLPRNNGKGAWLKTVEGGRTIERVQGMVDSQAFAEFRIPTRVGHLIQRGDY